MKYKKSEFNYIQKNKDSILIYNTLYNSLVRLTEEEYYAYVEEYEVDHDLEKQFFEQGLWVPENLDEKQRYLACSEAYTMYMPRPLNITITTTLKCNARCPYCYEKGVKQSDIVEGSEEQIIKFIKERSNVREVHIVWFGGEPLLNSEFIDKMSNRLNKEGIKYSSYIITNGSMLDEDIIENKLTFWNVKDMQITLDGTKEVYEKRKNYHSSKEGDFYKILNSISKVAKKGVFVNIRLNIDAENKTEILKLLMEIDDIYSSYENVVFYPAFITGIDNKMSEKEKVVFVKEMLLSMKNIKKLTASTKFYSLPRMHACMNGDPKSFSVDVNGDLFICEHYVGINGKRIGTLKDGLEIEDSRGKHIEFRKECDDCVFLPKCYGGCKSNYLEGDSPCMIEKYLIKAYLEIL